MSAFDALCPAPATDRRTSAVADRPVTLAAVTWNFALVGRTRMLTEAWMRLRVAPIFVQVPSLRTALEKVLAPFRSSEPSGVIRPWPVRPARWWNPHDEGGLRRMVRKRAARLRRRLERVIDLSDATAIVVSPVWTPWLEELPFGRVVYDCIDEVTVHVPRTDLTPLYQKWEFELIARASGAVATADTLAEGLRARNPRLPVAVIRNGVDAERFEQAARAASRPADLPASSRPIVGFVGALYNWIDWRLIADVAHALPEYDFVLVGPHDGRGAPRLLDRVRNARLLGPRPYARVPAYMAAFDVAWVPFDQSRVSRAANPVKIYEYLAVGKPVVTTPVADTDSFGALVRVGRTPAEIIEHLRAALAERDSFVDERKAFARANSWDARAREYLSFIASLRK